MPNDLLHDQAAALFALLRARGIDFVLVGGLALLQYVPLRSTVDIDLIVALADLERVPDLAVEISNPDFARCRFGELIVDALLTRNRLFDTVRRHHATVRHFAEGDIPCATVEGLLLLKLYALPSLYRQGDFARVNLYESDIAALFHAYDPPLAPIAATLARHLSAEDHAAVSEVMSELQQRVQRFRSSAGPTPGGNNPEPLP
ncbi:MAG: hypothetical protein ACRC1H_02285 [Caldilineaceae bacterium]